MQSSADPRVLNELGNAALARGDAQRAVRLLAEAVARVPNEPAVQFNLALAHRACGDLKAAIRHLDLALTADPYFVHAMYEKGVVLEALGMEREAALTFKDLLDCAPAAVHGAPKFRSVLEHARAVVNRNGAHLEQAVRQRLLGDGAPHAQTPSRRVSECIDALLGKQPVYVQRPTFLHVPRLPAIPFFDRSLTPWLETLENAACEIRAELQSLLEEGATDFEPYIDLPSGQPKDQWANLNRSLDWSAFFFWRHGKRDERNCARCPRTAAVLEEIPLARIPRRSPTALFSVLRPGTRIPPHTGVSNMRSVVHLPLIVPPECGFRVGAESRQWQEGAAWVFDDTIEHEAWNDSGAVRGILIADIWNPFINSVEREQLCAVLDGFDAYYGRVLPWDDRP
jgi:aspartate beta-hydroxylase